MNTIDVFELFKKSKFKAIIQTKKDIAHNINNFIDFYGPIGVEDLVKIANFKSETSRDLGQILLLCNASGFDILPSLILEPNIIYISTDIVLSKEGEEIIVNNYSSRIKKNYKTSLSDEKIEQIYALADKENTVTQISALLNINPVTILNVIKRDWLFYEEWKNKQKDTYLTKREIELLGYNIKFKASDSLKKTKEGKIDFESYGKDTAWFVKYYPLDWDGKEHTEEELFFTRI
jgi:hypothetical protein